MTDTGYDAVAAKAKARWADPKFRARVVAKLQARAKDPKVRKRQSDSARAAWVGADERRAKVSAAMSAYRKGRALSAEHKAAISKGGMGRTASKATRRKRSRALKGIPLTAETRAKLAVAQVAYQGTQRAERAESKRVTAAKKRLQWHACACSIGCLAIVKTEGKMYARGHAPASVKHLSSYKPYKYEGSHGTIMMRSSWEVAYARYLDMQGVQWEYESRSYFVGRGDWSGVTYTPDFYLPTTKSVVEIKGYFSQKQMNKMTYFRGKYPNLPVKLVFEEGMMEVWASLGESRRGRLLDSAELGAVGVH